MAAPNIVGSPEPDDPDPSESDPGGDDVRAERIAELAARLAAIEIRDRAAARRGSASAPAPGTGPSPVAPTSTARPIGSAGSARGRHAEVGGHPEDAPGDPETVAKAICLRLLTAAARPRAALATALAQRGIPDDVANSVLNRFVEVGLIDDRAYAEAFVTAKHRDRALGVAALRTELRRKGVDDITVDAAVQTLDQNAERERARTLISRRVDAAMGNGVPAARRRLVGLLARRGYSADLARQVVDEAIAEYGAEEEGGWLD